MRISDWSSDVCSSDLIELDMTGEAVVPPRLPSQATAGGIMPRRITVLVLDDDPQVRKGMARVLESWGCAVMTAGDYDAAATLVAAAPEGVDQIGRAHV